MSSLPVYLLALGLLAPPALPSEGSAEEPVRPPRDRPHVIIWMIDTLRADHLSCYGYERVTSPHIDALAREGVLFTQAHAHSNWTQPSVSSLFSARYPAQYEGDFTNTVPRELILAAEWLSAHGYATAGFTVSVAVGAIFGFDQGFDVYEELDEHLERRDRKRRAGDAFDAERVVVAALDWIDEEWDGERPFFLYLHTVDPHMPTEPHGEEYPRWHTDEGPPGVLDGTVDNMHTVLRDPDVRVTADDKQYITDLYDGEIAYNDAWFGRLRAGLTERGLFDDALVVIVSDHGEELWERTTHGHGHLNLHAELTHIPLIFRWPAKLPAGRRVEGLMRMVDVLPTLLDVADLPSLPEVDGRSVFPEILSGATLGSGEDPLVHFVDRAKERSDVRAVRTNESLFIMNPRTRTALLFDLLADPDAREDVGRARPSEVGRNLRRLSEFHQLLLERKTTLGDRDKLALDPETAARLQALGYLGDSPAPSGGEEDEDSR